MENFEQDVKRVARIIRVIEHKSRFEFISEERVNETTHRIKAMVNGKDVAFFMGDIHCGPFSLDVIWPDGEGYYETEVIYLEQLYHIESDLLTDFIIAALEDNRSEKYDALYQRVFLY